MNRLSAVAVLVLCCGVPAAARAGQEVFHYRGQTQDASGQPLEGPRAVSVRYFDGDQELVVEEFTAVAVSRGRFELGLGAGALRPGSPFADIQELFAHHPVLELAFAIDGVEQSPRVRLLPAGHSMETRMILAGLASANDSAPHSKKYRAKSDTTAVQAAILRPGAAMALVEEAAPEFQQGAMELEVEGPYLSQALRDLPTIDMDARPEVEDTGINPPRHETVFDANGERFGTTTEKIVDPLLDISRAPAGSATPGPLLNFEGVGNVNGVLPPDTHGAVGPNHYVQVVNLSFAIYSKAGALVSGPFATNVLWTGSGNSCATTNDGDAIFLYDRQADRWVLTQFTLPSGTEAVCFAVSQTPDPTGAYYLYRVPSQRFPDYFKLGTWTDPANNAWFMGTNSGAQNQYDVYAIDREKMLQGLAARPAQFFQSFSNLMMPADVDSVSPPPAGSSGLFYTFRDGGEPYFGSPPTDSLDLWAFHVDWTVPANSTFSLLKSFTPVDGFANFNWTICGFFSQQCLDQPGSTQNLDSGSWWPMQRLQYRKFADHEALVGSWTVDVTGSPDLAGVRWFELRRTGGNWSIFQQGTHAPDGSHRWFGSAAMDAYGAIAVGYSVMNATTNLFPSIRYALRAETDPPGTLRTEATLFTGTGAQTHTAARWGDYSSMTVDPVDGCTFWYTTEYIQATGSAPWQTRIGTFKSPACSGLDIAPLARQACTTAPNVTYGITLLPPTFVATTNLTLDNCPAGGSCVYTPAQVIFPADTSTLTISNLGAIGAGTFAMTAHATDSVTPAITRALPLSLTLFGAAPAAPSLTAPANLATQVASKPTISWTAVADATGYTLELDDAVSFASPFYSVQVSGTSHTLSVPLPRAQQVFWRVRANNPCGDSVNSATFSFTVSDSLCFSPNLAIPDDPDVSDTRIVTGYAGNISDLDLVIRATHTWVSDMIFRLVHVDTGTTVTVIDRPGSCSGDNFDVRLNDEGTDGTVESACNATPPAVSGNRTPNNPLSAFDTQSATGSWRLECSDQAGQDVGVLQEWCLNFTGATSNLIFTDTFEFGSAGLWSAMAP